MWSVLREYPGIFMEELTTTTERTQVSRPLGLNLGPAKYEMGGLTTFGETVSYVQSHTPAKSLTLINKNYGRFQISY